MTDRAEAVNGALGRPKTSAARERELFQLFEEELRGERPDSLSEPGGDEFTVRWHGDCEEDLVPLVQILFLLVPQNVGDVDISVATGIVQVIPEVPVVERVPHACEPRMVPQHEGWKMLNSPEHTGCGKNSRRRVSRVEPGLFEVPVNELTGTVDEVVLCCRRSQMFRFQESERRGDWATPGCSRTSSGARCCF